MSNVAIKKVVAHLVNNQTYDHDLSGGVVSSASNDKRYFYLSTQLIQTFQEVLQSEVGDSWKHVMNSCGHFWGLGLYDDLVSEVYNITGEDFKNLTINQYIKYLDVFFKSNGLGCIYFNLDHIEQGIVIIKVNNSIFHSALNDNGEYEDYILTGLFQALFEKISDHDLLCLQVKEVDPASSGGTFLVSGRNRIESQREHISQLEQLDEVVAALS